jgi:hypothetical protein
MAAGDVNVLGPYTPADKTGIDTALTGQVLVADLMVPYYDVDGRVYFVIVKAA